MKSRSNQELLLGLPWLGRCFVLCYAMLPALAVYTVSMRGLLTPSALEVMMFFGPLVAVGLGMRRRWAWYGLHLHTLLVLILGILAYGKDSPWLIAGLQLFSLGASIYFSGREVRRPYMEDSGRGFRLSRRYEVDIVVNIVDGEHKREAYLTDLSEKGAYIVVRNPSFKEGQQITIELLLRDRTVICDCYVISVFHSGAGNKPPGIGVHFQYLKTAERQAINDYLQKGRRYRRYQVEWPIGLALAFEELKTKTIDVSLGGCYVLDEEHVFEADDHLHVRLALPNGETLDCQGEVVWIASAEQSHPHKPLGMAIRFVDLSLEEIDWLRDSLEQVDRAASA